MLTSALELNPRSHKSLHSASPRLQKNHRQTSPSSLTASAVHRALPPGICSFLPLHSQTTTLQLPLALLWSTSCSCPLSRTRLCEIRTRLLDATPSEPAKGQKALRPPKQQQTPKWEKAKGQSKPNTSGLMCYSRAEDSFIRLLSPLQRESWTLRRRGWALLRLGTPHCERRDHSRI